MKKSFVLFLLLLSIVYCFDIEYESKDKVGIKKVTEYHFGISQEFGDNIEQLKHEIISEYNIEGFRTRVLLFDVEDFQNVGKLEFKYNFDNNLTEFSVYDSVGILQGQSMNKYDNNGNLIECLSYKSDTLEKRILMKYDDNGNLIEKSTYDSDIPETKSIMKYDENNNVINFLSYKSDTLEKRILMKIDDNGNLIEKSTYDSDILETKSIMKYDENNNVIEKTKFSTKDKLDGEKWTYIYNTKNDIIEGLYYVLLDKFGGLEILTKKTVYEYEYYE